MGSIEGLCSIRRMLPRNEARNSKIRMTSSRLWLQKYRVDGGNRILSREPSCYRIINREGLQMTSFTLLDEVMINRLKRNNQPHVLRFWDDLNIDEQWSLCTQLESINFETLQRAIDQSESIHKSEELDIQPVEDDIVGSASKLTKERYEELFTLGLEEIARGRIGMLVLAGGQGTRLHTDLPKGIFDLGLLSCKTLFQLQAEKLLRIKELIKERLKGDPPAIPWYIMTSEHTLEETEKFFDSKRYFGYPQADVIFFEQNHLPVLHFNRKIVLAEKHKIGMAPDGNGGLFSVLEKTGVLTDMRKRGVDYLHVCSVDNVLARILDPAFIGFSISQNVDCSLKVIRKQEWNESLGVVCKSGSSYRVVEYSEIPPNLASKVNEKTGELVFRHGNICVHFFSRSFLEHVSENHLADMPFHVARKKMASIILDMGVVQVPTEPNVMKFEKFIFDVVPLCKKFRVWEVRREDEFSPLKNGDSSEIESPSSCRRDLERLHLQWLRNSGILSEDFPSVPCQGKDTHRKDKRNVVEVSPLVSYRGEGLDEIKLKITEPYSALEKINGECKVMEI